MQISLTFFSVSKLTCSASSVLSLSGSRPSELMSPPPFMRLQNDVMQYPFPPAHHQLSSYNDTEHDVALKHERLKLGFYGNAAMYESTMNSLHRGYGGDVSSLSPFYSSSYQQQPMAPSHPAKLASL